MDIKLHVLEEITDNFSEELKIGSGGYGNVYRGTWKNQEVAVKRLHHEAGLPEDNPFGNEFPNLMSIEHPHVVRLVGYCFEIQHKNVEYNGKLQFSQCIHRALCFEYLQGGSLEKYLKDSHDYDWPMCYNIIKGICEGLNFLHQQSIYHLDLKPANILLDKNMVVKVADLGSSRLARTNTQTTKKVVGTTGYMPPEYLNNGIITGKNDVYSLGIIIIQIMAGHTGYSEFRETDEIENLIEMVNTSWRERISTTMSPWKSQESNQVETCVNLAIKCIDNERKNRPTITEIADILRKTEKSIPEKHWRNRAQFLLHQALGAMASNSPGGKFNSDPVPENPKISAPFSQQLDNVLGCTTRNNEAVGVVIVYAFDCTTSTPAWYKMDDVYSLVEEKLTDLVDTIGYIFVMSTPKTYRSDMKSVDSAETQKTGYRKSPAWRKADCTKQMACGLDKAHKLISDSGNKNGIILVFSDGSTHKGDFFDGAKDFVSKVPVHTFILYGQD